MSRGLDAKERSRGGLQCKSISHGFENGRILEDVTLSVDPGEIFVVIGPSGTGKTTLLRILSMFERPDSGTVQLFGEDVWSLTERERLKRRRRTAMVFQQANLFNTTVYRNVSYGLRVRTEWTDRLRTSLPLVGRSLDPETVSKMLEVVGLDGAEDRESSSLSGGEAQRVAFARALATGSDYLLLDEPTSDLDPRNTAVIEDAIRTASTRNRGIVIATHDMNQAERLADRVAVMIDGHITEVGSVSRVFSDPDDTRTRRFINGELVY